MLLVAIMGRVPSEELRWALVRRYLDVGHTYFGEWTRREIENYLRRAIREVQETFDPDLTQHR